MRGRGSAIVLGWIAATGGLWSAGCNCDGVLDTQLDSVDTGTGSGGGTVATTSPTTTSGAMDEGGPGGGRTDAGDPYEPFGPCPTGGPCPMDPSEACIQDSADAPTYSFCSATCLDASQCPAPTTGNAVASCEPLTPLGIPFNACVLRCESGATCPDGMECTVVIPGAGWCTWPT